MIEYKPYFDRLVSINLQFDLAFRAIEGFKGSDEALNAFAAEELDDLNEFLTEASVRTGRDIGEHWAFTDSGAHDYMQDVREQVPIKLQDVENRLRQNKVILIMSVFESAMKDIHKAALQADPTKLRHDRSIPLGKLVATSKDEIIEEEIERAIHGLDRMSVEARAKYFDETLNMSWFEGTIVPLIDWANNLRNEILHYDPDVNVSDQDVGLVFAFAFSLVMVCIMHGSVLYPTHFTYDGDLSDLRQRLTDQGRMPANN